MSYVNPEYVLCRQVAYYLRAQYPKTLFRFDYAGNNLSKTQAGMNKMIQCRRGFPDLEIFEKRNGYGGLLIELKPEGTKLYKKDGTPVTPHIAEQLDCLLNLKLKGYCVSFGIGFENTGKLIDDYPNNRL
jgi:hypothetical protein